MNDDPSANSNIESYLARRIEWLIRLRWIAIIGVLSTVCVIPRVSSITLAAAPLYSVAAFLLLYNFFFWIHLRFGTKPSLERLNVLANCQITLDLLSLAALLHFSGGIENPFLFYFIFHVIIASILLPRRAAFLQATYAVVLFLGVTTLEYWKILPHYSLPGFLPAELYHYPPYVVGTAGVFISTIYLAAYLATSITKQLQEKERHLEESNQLLNEKDRIKSEYVLRVTHDIRQDLAAIESCIEPVTMGITGQLNPGQRDLLDRVHARSQMLIVYIDALLEITRLKLKQQLRLEPISFAELAEEISAEIGELARNRGLRFLTAIAQGPLKVQGVRVYLKEAVMNLLKNSLKYTPAGGEIRFESTERDGKLIIRIADTGIGVPAEDLPHLFEEFYRASNAVEKERKGTGLGLSITKQIVEMHGGNIRIESTIGEGTSTWIEIPSFSKKSADLPPVQPTQSTASE